MNNWQLRDEPNALGNDDGGMIIPFLQNEIEVEDQLVLDRHNNADPNVDRRTIQPAFIEEDYLSDDDSRNSYDDRHDHHTNIETIYNDQERLRGVRGRYGSSCDFIEENDSSTTFSTSQTNHRRNGWYIASITLKIISIISATICTTTVFWMSMFEHHLDSDFLETTEYQHVTDTTGGIMLLLDLLAVPFMAWAGGFVAIVLGSKKRSGDNGKRRANILKLVSILLYFLSLLFAAGVIYFSDSTTNPRLVLMYVLLSNLSWVLMFVYVKWCQSSPISKASHPVSCSKS